MRRVFTVFMAGCLLLFFAAACARPDRTLFMSGEQAVSAPTATAPAAPVFRETGVASWYGREMEGRTLADGTTFQSNGVSAAHRTLPLGTVITITNLDNDSSITTKVRDRGPLIRDRVVLLSYGAARELGFVAHGTATVGIETLEPVPEGGTWTVLAASFAEEKNAKVLKYRLSRRYRVVDIVSFDNNIGTFYRVLVGHYASEEKAERIAAKLMLEGLEPLVMRRD